MKWRAWVVTHRGVLIRRAAYALLLAAWCLLPGGKTTILAAAERCYVNDDAAGTSTGASWTDAYTDLQSALNNAGCGEVWVATGIYTPGPDRADTFKLRSGQAVYGEFAGDETSLTERGFVPDDTILSGEIGDPLAIDDNTLHVVTGSGTGATTVLDGFTITGGNANGAAPHYNGGGIFIQNGSPTLHNLIISGNRASSGGGGIAIAGGSPDISRVFFVNNQSQNGGGLHSVSSSPRVDASVFLNNDGVAMYNDKSTVLVTNAVFYGNTGHYVGNAIANSESTVTLVNMTINDPRSSSGYSIANGDGSVVTITNSIIWYPEKHTPIFNSNSNVTISSSDVISSNGSGPLWNTKLGTDGGGNIDIDPLFVNPAALDLHLLTGSPAIDRGYNQALPEGDRYDLEGKGRVVDGDGDGVADVDLGAVEVQMLNFIPLAAR